MRRLRRFFLRPPRKNTAARYDREYRNKDQRKSDVSEGHWRPPMLNRHFQLSVGLTFLSPTYLPPNSWRGGDRAQVDHDRIEIIRSERRIITVAHRRLQLTAVAADAFGDRALDLIVGPAADALFLARGDIARNRDAPRPGKFEAASAEPGRELAPARTHGCVALHAVRDGDKVEALLQFVAQHGACEQLVAAGWDRMSLRYLVDRIWHRVIDRLDRM